MRLRSYDAILGTCQNELINFTESEVDDLEALSDRILNGFQVVTVHIIDEHIFSWFRLGGFQLH